GVRILAQPYPYHALTRGADLGHERHAVGGDALERDRGGVHGEDLGPGQRGESPLAGLAYGQVDRVGHEGLVRHERRARMPRRATDGPHESRGCSLNTT